MHLKELKEALDAYKALTRISTGESDFDWGEYHRVRAEAWKAAFFFEFYNGPYSDNHRAQLPLIPGEYVEGIALIQETLRAG